VSKDKLAALRPPRPSTYTPFFRRWFGNEAARERRETVELHESVRRCYEASAWAGDYKTATAFRKLMDALTPAIDDAAAHLPTELKNALFGTWCQVLQLEAAIYPPPEIDWSLPMTPKEAVELRSALRAQEYFLAHSERCSIELIDAIGTIFVEIARALPPMQSADSDLFSVPLVHLMKDLREIVHHIIAVPSQEIYADLGLFTELRTKFYFNLCAASNVVPGTEHKRPLAWPKDSTLPPSELATTYLDDTPFLPFLLQTVPLAVPKQTLFSHMHVCGGTGAGKSQWLSTLILHHLQDPDKPALVIIDSQGDLIGKLSRIEAVAERAILISPKDVRHPPAINVFDVKQSRIGSYDEVTREQVVAGAIQTFDYLFAGLLGADLTAKQSVFFRFVCRLLLTLPNTLGRNATIIDMIDLMEDETPYQRAMEALPLVQRRFFERDFKEKSFQATKEQIRYRLNSILENPTMERLFTATETRLDLFEELNKGSIILVDTAKDFLKQSSSAFGRLFISLVLQAILERAAIEEKKRKPAFLIIDEAERMLGKIEGFLSDDPPPRTGRAGKSAATRARTPKAETAKIRQDVLDAIQQNPTNGVAAKDLYGMLEPHGYKRSAINAALFALSKEGDIKQSGRRQPYTLATSGSSATSAPPTGAASAGARTDEDLEEIE
jgi:Type IV secretion-system coupling protein DNA-binding domain